MKRISILLLLITLLVGCAPAGPGAPAPLASPRAAATPTSSEPTELVVFAAGSLIQPFAELEAAFETLHPEIDVQNEFHGSIQVIRHATELHESIDVVATADHALIPMLMFETTDPESGRPNADWYIRFAANKLGLAYSDRSLYHAEVNAENWTEILTRPDVKVGIADPRFDAAGYRALMITQLAESRYDHPALFQDIFGGMFRAPITLREEGAGMVIHVPEVLETKDGARVVVRGSSIQLIALLESGDLDYAFEYVSVIRQHGLGLVEFPPEINLGEPDQADQYGRVTVALDFQRFSSVKPVFQGEQIGYGITIPATAAHPQAAETFIAFLLSPQGREIMQQNFHPLLDSPEAIHYDQLPAALQALCAPAR